MSVYILSPDQLATIAYAAGATTFVLSLLATLSSANVMAYEHTYSDERGLCAAARVEEGQILDAKPADYSTALAEIESLRYNVVANNGRDFGTDESFDHLRAAVREHEALRPAKVAPPSLAPAHVRCVDRNDAIARLKAALKKSGKTWSVTGGRGTAWGWLNITAPPSRCGEFGYMTESDRAELATLIGRDRPCHMQGESVSPEDREFIVERVESIARAV